MSVELCRLCGKDGVNNVFDETDLWRKIFVCFGVEINVNDKITQKICKSCYFFTNSVYEFRLNSIEHDNKLKKENGESHPKIESKEDISVPISYPSEISQDAFLNTLNLASKIEVCVNNTPVFHPSVVNLKRKWPNINIPKECYELNLEPFISLEVPPKLLKLSSPKLGIWSVKNKQNHGKQPDLVLTRVRSTHNSTESLNSGSDKAEKLKIKFNFKSNSNAANVSQQPSALGSTSSSNDSTSRRKKNKFTNWYKRKKGSRLTQPKKKSSSDKNRKTNTIQKGRTSPAKSENNSVSASSSRNIAKERSTLKHLLESDAQLNETLPRPSSDRPSSPDPKNEEYGNLLVAAGEEVQTFICVTCNKIFDTLVLLNNHKKYSHKSSLQCTKCSKRFAIVESLVKHNLSCHPETVVKVNSSTTNNNPETVASTSNATNDNQSTKPPVTVARKHTNGALSDRSAINSPTQTEILEYVISDDDDVEITDVIENSNASDTTRNVDSPLETIINAALEPQKSSNSETNNADCPLLYDALFPQIGPAYSEDKQKDPVDSQTPEVVNSMATKPDDIFLIDDSDDEKDNNNPKDLTTNKEEQSFVILDDSNSSKDAEVAPSCSSSSAPSTSTDTRNGKADKNVSQKIVVVPSAEDKALMDSSSVKAKITNELSYINYIFNKCNFSCMKSDNSKEITPEKKWLLKDVHKFTEKTFLPVELNRVFGEDASIEYSPVIPAIQAERLPFWDSINAIDVPKKSTVPKWEPAINLQAAPKQMICKESSFVSQPATKKGTSKVKPDEKSLLKPKAATYGPTAKPGVSSTVVAKTVNIPTATVQSEAKVSSPVHTTTNTSTPVALVRSTNVQNTSNVVPNTMFVVSQNPQPGGSIQVITSSPNESFLNKPIQSSANVASHPSVAVSSPGLQAVQSPPHIDIHTTQKLLNFALQNAALGQVRTYNKTQNYPPIPSNPNTTLPISTRSSNETIVSTPPLQDSCNGYILVGVSTASNDTGGLILDESNGGQKQPIVLNGMSYPSFAKIRNSNAPTFVVQQVGQQTNVNIQNCINICQQEVVTTNNTVNEQFQTMPYVMRDQSTAPVITGPPAPVTVQAMAPMMLQSVSSVVQSRTTETTSDATVSTTRPSIRIKNLSELRENNLDTNQRNELHNLYSNTLTNYVQNYSNNVANPSPNDEYLQIS